MKLGAVILAAGASARMGQPKLLLPWGQTSVLRHLVATWREVGSAQVAVVCRPDAASIQQELSRLNVPATDWILNPQPDLGMFESIRCAARSRNWIPELTHYALVLGDQPHIPKTTILTLLEFVSTHPGQVCQPALQGRPRHPVILPREIFVQLPHSDARTLKLFLHSYPAAQCEMEDPALDLDMDAPGDYERAKRLYFDGASPDSAPGVPSVMKKGATRHETPTSTFKMVGRDSGEPKLNPNDHAARQQAEKPGWPYPLC